VVKHRATGQFFQVGETEHFLLSQLDGQTSSGAICTRFEQQFGQPLSAEELEEFVAMATEQGLVGFAKRPPPKANTVLAETASESAVSYSQSETRNPKSRQSVLYWRKSLFDPDRLFTRLEPRIRFFWTRGFLVVSTCSILAATAVLAANRTALAETFADALRWESLLLVWITLLAVTTLHEFAHGLTCKHYGGEVREIGFLMMFFMPCFYCNVSDAWLFREKSKRLWVTLAGGYFELFLWSLAVFVWRLTQPGTAPHWLAFLVVTGSGVKTLFNFNPLLKLDGYYLLSDWLEIPNLRQRATEYLAAHARRLLWGGPRPEREPRGRCLLGYGLASWIYSICFLGLMLATMFQFLWRDWGWLGLAGVGVLGLVSTRGLFQGIAAGEVRKMVASRHKRTAIWLLGLAALAAALAAPIEDRVSGEFTVHPACRAELAAPLDGFLAELTVRQGDRLSAGQVIGRLAVHDLDSRIAQKEAEIREAEARLRLLEIGPRPEEIARQTRQVEQAEKLLAIAERQSDGWRRKLEEELDRLDEKIGQLEVERVQAEREVLRVTRLRDQQAVGESEVERAATRLAVAGAHVAQARAERQARQAEGYLEAEATLALREKESVEARGQLMLLEAGSRPEEVAAAAARCEGLREELALLRRHRDKLALRSPVSGVMVTARVHERLGRYFAQGEAICEVESVSDVEAAIEVDEQDVRRIAPGQHVTLKPRALPFDRLQCQVEQIAPRATQDDHRRNFTITCQLEAQAALRPGMGGYARIHCGRRPGGEIVLEKVLRYLRTEFWW
jgi:multidrug resistance efflux pump